MDYNTLERAYNDRVARYNMAYGTYTKLKQDHETATNSLKQMESDLLTSNGIRTLYEKTADEARGYAKNKLEDRITEALQHVFGPNYKFVIDITRKNNKPHAECFIETNRGAEGIIRTSPVRNGGGVVDIIAIAARFAMILLTTGPKLRGTIVFDEPGKHVSAEYSGKLGEFLKYISSAFGRQIINVTHNDDIKHISDITYYVNVVNGEPQITAYKGGVQQC